jgi:hypothetical protein
VQWSDRVSLDFYVEDLAATIHPVGGVHAVRAEECAVLRILRQLWQLELHCTAALAAALLGLFAFWLCHEICLLYEVVGTLKIVQSARIKESEDLSSSSNRAKFEKTLGELEDGFDQFLDAGLGLADQSGISFTVKGQRSKVKDQRSKVEDDTLYSFLDGAFNFDQHRGFYQL